SGRHPSDWCGQLGREADEVALSRRAGFGKNARQMAAYSRHRESKIPGNLGWRPARQEPLRNTDSPAVRSNTAATASTGGPAVPPHTVTNTAAEPDSAGQEWV